MDDEEEYGEAVFSLDFGRDTPEACLLAQIRAVEALSDSLEKMNPEPLLDAQDAYSEDMKTSDDDGEIDYSWYDQKLDEALEELGYVSQTNTDSGMWSIHKKVDSTP